MPKRREEHVSTDDCNAHEMTLVLPLFSGSVSQAECSLLCRVELQGQADEKGRNTCQ